MSDNLSVSALLEQTIKSVIKSGAQLVADHFRAVLVRGSPNLIKKASDFHLGETNPRILEEIARVATIILFGDNTKLHKVIATHYNDEPSVNYFDIEMDDNYIRSLGSAVIANICSNVVREVDVYANSCSNAVHEVDVYTNPCGCNNEFCEAGPGFHQ